MMTIAAAKRSTLTTIQTTECGAAFVLSRFLKVINRPCLADKYVHQMPYRPRKGWYSGTSFEEIEDWHWRTIDCIRECYPDTRILTPRLSRVDDLLVLRFGSCTGNHIEVVLSDARYGRLRIANKSLEGLNRLASRIGTRWGWEDPETKAAVPHTRLIRIRETHSTRVVAQPQRKRISASPFEDFCGGE